MSAQAQPTGEKIKLSKQARNARSRTNVILFSALTIFAVVIYGVSISRLGGADPVGNSIESRQ